MEIRPTRNEIIISYKIVTTKQGRAIENFDLYCIDAIVEMFIYLN